MKSQDAFIPITRPVLGKEETEAVAESILSGWVSQGPEVANFERDFSAIVGAEYSCAVSSCTTGLHLALLGVGVKAGDEVITVSHSFIATANAIHYCGAIPVFVDIEKDSFNIDVTKIEEFISKKTKAILCVHQMGMPCDLKGILELAGKYGLPVIEDAACAIGSEVLFDGEWQAIGRPHGDIACFSFHPRKVLTTGDGGMITTNNPEYDKKFRLLRQHGMSVSDTVRHGASDVIFESYEEVGFNYRMTDIQAAIGRVQLRRLSGIVRKRRELASRYNYLLSGADGLHLPIEQKWARSNWQSYCVKLSRKYDQRTVMQAMLDQGVATRRGVMCIHREKSYIEMSEVASSVAGCTASRYISGSLDTSEYCQDTGIILPLFPDMTSNDQDRVVKVLKNVLSKQIFIEN